MMHEISNMDEECPVCWEPIPMVHIIPCNHSLCKSCLNKNLSYRSTCPMCRRIVQGCVPNFVIDNHISYTIKTIDCDSTGSTFGVVLVDGLNCVVVQKTARKGLARAHGFKKGDKIYVINGVPSCNKSCAVQLLKSLVEEKQSFSILVSTTIPTWKKWIKYFSF